MSRAHRPARASAALFLSFLGLTGCQGILSTPNTAQIRIIDASPDAPMLDLYQGPSALTYNLTFGNITSYIPVAQGTSDLAANRSGSRQSLAITHESLVPGQYTLLLGSTSANLQPLLLKDQSTPAPSGQVALRFVDQVTAAHAYDVYLVPPGTSVSSAAPILTSQTFNVVSGYLNLPAGAYRIILYPSGAAPSTAVPAAYSGPTVAYLSGMVRTVVLLDQRVPLRPSVQLITATDVDPAPTAN